MKIKKIVTLICRKYLKKKMNKTKKVKKKTKKKLKKTGINLTQEKGNYYLEKWCYNGIVNLQMLDSNENKAKGSKTFEDWAKSTKLDFKKQLLPDITKMAEFPDFVDKRWKESYSRSSPRKRQKFDIPVSYLSFSLGLKINLFKKH